MRFSRIGRRVSDGLHYINRLLRLMTARAQPRRPQDVDSKQKVGWASAHCRMLRPLASVSQFCPLNHPIDRIRTERNTQGEARKRPVGGMCGKPVLDRIEMDVVHMNGVIRVAADRVLPIPALPNAGIALANQGCAAVFRPRHGS